MASPLVIRRIEAWEAAGLIDSETANRLREAEADVLPEPRLHRRTRPPPDARSASRRSSCSSISAPRSCWLPGMR